MLKAEKNGKNVCQSCQKYVCIPPTLIKTYRRITYKLVIKTMRKNISS